MLKKIQPSCQSLFKQKIHPGHNDMLNEKALRSYYINSVGKENFNNFKEVNLFYTLKDFFFIFFIFITNLFLYKTFLENNIFVGLFFNLLLFSICFNWMNVQIHEASHFLLFKHKNMNKVFANVLYGSFIFQDVESYSSTHSKHHLRLHTNEDPDLWIYKTDKKIWKLFLCDLILLTALKRFIQIKNLKIKKKKYITYTTLCIHSILISIIYYLNISIMLFYFIYLYALLGIYPVLIRVRTSVQHKDETNTPSPSQKNTFRDQNYISRSTFSNLIEHFIIGAQMDWHLEHHLFPYLPYYQAKKLHQLMLTKELHKNKNYLSKLSTTNFLKTFITLHGKN